MGCTGLTAVHVQAVHPPAIGDNLFLYCTAGLKIYVPMASESEYKADPRWKIWKDFIVGE
jgi:hypothetical protein